MPKLLIVEETAVELRLLREILSDAGWEAVAADSGAEAVRMANAEPFDVVLLSLLMPDMDGLEACRQLQANPGTRKTPVVFVSGRHRKADRMWAMMNGARGVIEKPYRAQQVLETIAAYG